MRVYAVQFDIAWEQPEENHRRVERLLREASPEPGALVALPEMFATGFSMNASAIAEPYGGPTEQFLGKLARDLGTFIVAGVAMKNARGSARNKALAFSPDGKLIGFYAKQRPFSPGKEHEHYTAGEQVTVLRLPGCAIAPFICYDLRFPELFRAAALQARPELYIVIASWPEKRTHHWVRLLQARAIENQAYVLGVNRIGSDPYYRYAGRTVLINADGEIKADAGGEETVVVGDLNLAELAKYRAGLPFLDDLRPCSLLTGPAAAEPAVQ